MVHNTQLIEPSLEDVFISLIGGSGGSAPSGSEGTHRR